MKIINLIYIYAIFIIFTPNNINAEDVAPIKQTEPTKVEIQNKNKKQIKTNVKDIKPDNGKKLSMETEPSPVVNPAVIPSPWPVEPFEDKK